MFNLFSGLKASLASLEAKLTAVEAKLEAPFDIVEAKIEAEFAAIEGAIENYIKWAQLRFDRTDSTPKASAPTGPSTADSWTFDGFATAPTGPTLPATPVASVPTSSSGGVIARAKTSGPTIAIVNASEALKGQDISAVIEALQIQVDRDFSPVWELGANLIEATPTTVPADAWVILLLDNSDQQGALGYHDLTTANLPVGKIFVGDDLKYGLSWTVTLSHELLEMLADPYIDTTVFAQETNTTGTLYAYECCDAVEDDSYGYKINNVLVSDFVFPAFFESVHEAGSTQFSFMKSVNQPFEIANGGYLSTFTVGPNCSGWQQVTGQSGMGRRLAAKGPESRKARRGHKQTV